MDSCWLGGSGWLADPFPVRDLHGHVGAGGQRASARPAGPRTAGRAPPSLYSLYVPVRDFQNNIIKPFYNKKRVFLYTTA